MPLNLMLFRHAKSDWSEPDLDDHERPLALRGIAAARAMGAAMAARGLNPDSVLCSPALRAQQTWREAAAAFTPVPPTRTVPALYDFGDGEALLNVIRQEGGGATRLMLVCHNPAIEQLAGRLSQAGDAALRQRMHHKFPTAALAVIAFPSATWAGIGADAGELTAFLRPRDIGASPGD